MTQDTRKCRKCGEEKPYSEFHRNKQGKNGHVSRCKSCVSHEWRTRRRFQFQERRYGITRKEYLSLLELQHGVCAICQYVCDKGTLAVDHEHSTGEIRGLLCRNCNIGLGAFMDDPERLRRAADYLAC